MVLGIDPRYWSCKSQSGEWWELLSIHLILNSNMWSVWGIPQQELGCFFRRVIPQHYRAGYVDRSGTGRGLRGGITLVEHTVSQECLLMGLAFRPAPAWEPLCSWEVAVLEKQFFAVCYRDLKDSHGWNIGASGVSTWFWEVAVCAFCRGLARSWGLFGLLLWGTQYLW